MCVVCKVCISVDFQQSIPQNLLTFCINPHSVSSLEEILFQGCPEVHSFPLSPTEMRQSEVALLLWMTTLGWNSLRRSLWGVSWQHGQTWLTVTRGMRFRINTLKGCAVVYYCLPVFCCSSVLMCPLNAPTSISCALHHWVLLKALQGKVEKKDCVYCV